MTRASTLGIRVNLGFCGTAASYILVRRCALMIRFIKAADSGQRCLRRFFYALFTGAYFTYTGILALAPEHGPPPPHWRDLYSPPAAGQVRRRNPSMTIIGRIIGAVILIALFMAIVVVLARLGF